MSLEMTNWSVFYGTHGLDLSVTEASPVVLVRGENMRGKTSILRAMMWCLYGEIKSQDGRSYIDVSEMVNWDAVGEGRVAFGVKMTIAEGESSFVLHRSGFATEDDSGQVRISGIEATLLPAGGQPMPAQAIDDYVNGLINKDIAEFFFFDGEMLSRFEERLKEDREGSKLFVRNQIERALGLPFLRSLSSDLEFLRSELSGTIEVAARRNLKATQLNQDYEEKKSDLASKERDLETLKQIETDLSEDIATIDKKMSEVEDIKDLFYQRVSLERDHAEYVDRSADVKAQLSTIAEKNWWFPLSDRLQRDLEKVRSDLVLASSEREADIRSSVKIEQLRAQLDGGICPTCGSTVEIHDESLLRQELAQLEDLSSSRSASSYDDLIARERALRTYERSQSVVARIFDLEQDLGSLRMKIDRNRSKYRDVSEALAGNRVDVAALEADLSQRKAELVRARALMEDADVMRGKLRSEVQTLSTKLAALPEVSDEDRTLLEELSEAVETVDNAFDSFRNSMRAEVEAEATSLFLRLTTEPDYQGVRIQPDYSLAVVDSQGRGVTRISAGGNQVLTMAFIGALGKSSTEEAPLVMDTPFGRLDLGHRQSIMEWVGSSSNQTILFVQSGEYDPARDGSLLSGRIGREYVIRRVAENRSEVVAA